MQAWVEKFFERVVSNGWGNGVGNGESAGIVGTAVTDGVGLAFARTAWGVPGW